MRVASLLVLLLAANSRAACVGPRTFSEARAQWKQDEWIDTRPAMALHNWTAHVPGDLVPPDNVTFGIVVYGIKSIDTVNQVATIDMFFRTLWTDPRIGFTPKSEGGCFSNPWQPEGELGYDGTPEGTIWTPGVAVMNEDVVEQVLYSAWWVYPSGFVWWAKKVQLKVKCNFDFARLPYDSQTCPIRLIGWRDVAHDITFSFQSVPGGSVQGRTEGMSMEWNITSITEQLANPSDSGFIWGGEGLQWNVNLERIPQYYETYNLLPTNMLVFTIYTSFFISRYAVPARIAMIMISLLGLINLSGGIRQDLPRTDQGCWLLSFITMAQWFVMYAGLEYATANLLTRAEVRIKTALQKQDKREKEKMSGGGALKRHSTTKTAMEVMQANDMEHDDSAVVAEASVAVDVVSDGKRVDVVSDGKRRARADEEARDEFSRLGRLMVWLGSEEKPFPRDEHLDIFSRFFFVPAWAICVGVMYAQLAEV